MSDSSDVSVSSDSSVSSDLSVSSDSSDYSVSYSSDFIVSSDTSDGSVSNILNDGSVSSDSSEIYILTAVASSMLCPMFLRMQIPLCHVQTPVTYPYSNTVEPLNSEHIVHIGTSHFVLYREIVLSFGGQK